MHYCVVTERQPPRSRVESAEGGGNARSRWFQFVSELPADAMRASGINDEFPLQVLSDEARGKLATIAKESSELLGFWVTWHLAGGFDRLESWGWHRATIYR